MSTIGHTAVGTVDDNIGADNKIVYSVTATENGLLTSLTGYLSGLGPGAGNQVIKAVVYAASGFNPGALLAVSNEITIVDNSAYAWYQFDLPAAVPISAGATYWIGYIAGATTTSAQKKVNVGGFLAYNANTGGYAAGPTNPFGSPSTTSIGELTLYGTYTPVGAADPPRVIPPCGVSNGFKILIRNTTDRNYEIGRCKDVGAQVLRIVADPDWSTELNSLVPLIAAQGLKMLLVLYGTTAPISPDTWPTTQANLWASTPEVIGFEIANEPDINGWTVNDYADFVADAYDQINAAQPGRYSVVAGALWKGNRTSAPGPDETTSLDPQHFAIGLATRAFGKFDYFSLHLYDNPLARQPWNIWDWGLFWNGSGYCDNGAHGGNCRQILDSYGLWNIPIITTETGGRILPDGSYTEQQVADFVTSAFAQVASGHVASVFVHGMMDDDVAGYGMLRPDLSPRPAYYAFLSFTTNVRVVIEAAFGSYPSDASYTWTTIHDTDLPEVDYTHRYVRGLRYSRGVDDLVGRTATGTGELLVRNSDRAWDAENAASSFYPNVRPDLPVRGWAMVAGVTYPMFQHFMDGFPRRRIAPNVAEVPIRTTDGFIGLARAAPQPDFASLTVDVPGVNNTLVFTAVNPGMAGEDITIQYIGGPFKPVRVAVKGKAIEIRYHMTGLHGDPDDTATTIKNAVNADGSASQLVVVTDGPVSDGSGTILTDFGPTNLAGADAALFPAESTGARMGRCLDMAGWPATLRALDDGTVNVAQEAFQTSDQGKLLSHMLDAAAECAEWGMVYADGGGNCTFLDWDTLYATGQGTVVATFSDRRSDGFIVYQDSQPNLGRERVINQWAGTRDGGIPQIVQDQVSIDQSVGINSKPVTSFLTTDAEVETSMQFGLDEYGTPVQVLESITVMPEENNSWWASCLSIEPGARVRVLEHPPGGGAAIDHDYIVLHLDVQIPAGTMKDAVFTFGLWPVRVENYFIFDDATYGNINTTVLAYN